MPENGIADEQTLSALNDPWAPVNPTAIPTQTIAPTPIIAPTHASSAALGTLEITDNDPNGANIRSSPDMSSYRNIMTTALKGRRFPYFGLEANPNNPKEGWYKIQLPDGRYGYVNANIVKIVN